MWGAQEEEGVDCGGAVPMSRARRDGVGDGGLGEREGRWWVGEREGYVWASRSWIQRM